MAPIIRRAFSALPPVAQTAVKTVLSDAVEQRRAAKVMEDSVRPGRRIVDAVADVTLSDPAPGDEGLTRRLMQAYRHSNAAQDLAGGSMWSDFFETYQRPLHEAFIGDDVAHAASILRHPAQNDLFYGFDFLSAAFLKNAKSTRWRKAHAASVADSLLRLAEMIAAVRHPNRERQSTGYEPVHEHAVDTCLAAVETALGCEIGLPTPFAGEHGIATPRGVMSYRVPQAIYQAYRVRQLTHGIASPAVLEIGGGLGRTAYFARALGITDYTIVDLPLTSVAQGSFLGRVLGDESIRLAGEDGADDEDRVKLLAPEAFLQGSKRYDLILNADSLTEMSEAMAEQYIAASLSRTSVILSINHESNGFTVNTVMRRQGLDAPIMRGLYPMRDGYLEEVLRLKPEGLRG